MRTLLRGGLVLGLLCGVWMLVVGYAGWYRDPQLANLFFIVVPIEIGVIAWTLRGSAEGGARYGAQVLNGLGMAMIGALVVMGFSVLFTTVLFPNYFQELAAIQEQMLRDAGAAEEQIRLQMDAYWTTAKPGVNALIGGAATVITGLLASLVLAIFVRAR